MKTLITKMHIENKRKSKALINLHRTKHLNLKFLFILGTFLLVWQGLSMVYSSIILPGPILTCTSIVTIIQSKTFWLEIFVTLQRLAIALLAAIVVGSILGIIMGGNKKLKNLFEPIVYIIQAVPPILYVTLAMIWFGLNGRATIFIIFIGSAPVMAVSIKEGFENIDSNLIEMGKAFKFSRWKMIGEIVLPSLGAYFKAGLITVFSFGWKLVIMGEVLSASTGIGAQIKDARMNLETNMVFAWGTIVILLCFLTQKITAKLFESNSKWRKNYGR